MTRRTLGTLIAAGAAVLAAGGWLALRGLPRGGVLHSVGPRLLSNQTSMPLAIYGEGIKAGDHLTWVRPDGQRLALPLTVLDARHAYVRVPPEASHLAPSLAQAEFHVGLNDQATLLEVTVVNDAEFVDLVSLVASRAGRWVFALSPTTDGLYAIDVEARTSKLLAAGDGPSGLALWVDGSGQEWLVVGHRYLPELWLVSVEGPGRERRVLPGPATVSGVVVDQASATAFVAEQARDTVAAISLPDGRQRWRSDVAPNPSALALFAGKVWAGSLQAGVIDALDAVTGARSALAVPTAQTRILGGHTEAFAPRIMGGKAPRSLVGSEGLGALFVASVGPNIGPNPERMEVTMNGGVGVVSPDGTFRHHLGFNAGVPEALVLDERAARLYVADLGAGLVRALDARALAAGGDAARQASVGIVPIAPPTDFPLVRPPADFGVHGRAGVEIHSGPGALALSADGRTLYALNRFTGTLAVIDTARMAEGAAALKEQIPVAQTLGQRMRRQGQVLYFTDVGRSAMSCDTCHLEGHGEGVLFEKTHPMRIYRSTTVRGVRETPPYFTPESTQSVAATIKDVGDRNRYHNPDLTMGEIEALTAFTASVTTLANPFLEPSGAPPESLALLDGKTGAPRRGLELFEGKAGCAPCHPSPLFTTDQDPSTRGKYLDVGTPKLFPLRTQWQELKFVGAGVPSLVGAWDIFPMLTTGSAGFGLEGEQLVVSNRFPLREVVEKFGGPAHGHTEELTAQEKDDLLAYLLTL